MAAPSVLTASPIQAAATIGWSASQVRANTGSRISSTTEKTTTSDDTITGTIGAGPNRGPGGDGRRHAADGNARGQRRRPLAAETEKTPGHEVDERPVNQIGLDDGRQTAKHDRLDQFGGAGRLDAQRGAEDDDGRLDEPLRPRRFRQPLRRAGKKLPITSPTSRATIKPASPVRPSDCVMPKPARLSGVAAIYAL